MCVLNFPSCKLHSLILNLSLFERSLHYSFFFQTLIKGLKTNIIPLLGILSPNNPHSGSMTSCTPIQPSLYWTLSNMFLCFSFWGAQNWIEHSRCGFINVEVEGKDHLPIPSGYTLPNAVLEAFDSLCCKEALLAHVQFVSTRMVILFYKAAFHESVAINETV